MDFVGNPSFMCLELLLPQPRLGAGFWVPHAAPSSPSVWWVRRSSTFAFEIRLICIAFLTVRFWQDGVQITAEAALMKLYNEDQFAAAKDVANVKVDYRTKESHGQKDVPVQEANNTLKNTKVENGSNSQHYSEGYNENEITQGQHEIDRYKEIKIVEKSELKVSDVDLETVLGEQDTHDLYCPNCRSRITRTVILRKRKRSESSTEETESDSYERTDPNDREPDVFFRCLSCLSFIIATDGGFNVFRIFEKREKNLHSPSSQQLPEKNINWMSYILNSWASKKKESEPGFKCSMCVAEPVQLCLWITFHKLLASMLASTGCLLALALSLGSRDVNEN